MQIRSQIFSGQTQQIYISANRISIFYERSLPILSTRPENKYTLGEDCSLSEKAFSSSAKRKNNFFSANFVYPVPDPTIQLMRIFMQVLNTAWLLKNNTVLPLM
jgi:hypothetical protein